ncbi:MAG: hypothetical protein JOZ46_02110 [Candidatus Dormibacteraeota bacterium]|nr:hypothetical protein [Candidatus Dormibacteraeota bacterium]MBV9524590.1 hypothetical protein [Candidatus Dormibacteraeota bacterium]
MTITATNVDALRQGWEDVAATLAPGVDELPVLLETRLEEAVRDDRLDETSLLAVVDEAWRIASRSIDQEQAIFFARRMQQAVYEFLLSLDAIVEPVDETPQSDTATPRGGPLIGVEEVASLPRHEPPVPHVVVEPAAPEAGADEPTAETPEPATEAAEPPVPEAVSEPEPPAPAPEPPAPEPDEPPVPEAHSLEPPRRRFTLFRRNGTTTLDGEIEAAGEPEPELEPQAEAEALPEPAPPTATAPPQTELEDLRQVLEEDDEPLPVPPPHFVAPRDGFHLTEFNRPAPPAQAAPPQADAAPAPTPPPIMRAAEPAPARPESAESRGWRIRNLRRRREETGAPQPGADASPDDAEEESDLLSTQSESRFDTDPEVLDARRQINDRLRRRRCDEAASLLQRLATDAGGREVAELALDAGDRCRALGKANAALSCYLAASRADPVLEAPLLRLADICIDDKDIDLAASYLERVARLHRLRGDRRGALRVYRKIATIAPYRDDILNLLMHVQATGRFEDE